ncbi:MAG TPA: ADP compounds hydrolase NudE [Acidiferrobacteraceae bacterium]|nr:ADP compounds hydrolase NudE [Acidiferrobacteraceae bacterium]
MKKKPTIESRQIIAQSRFFQIEQMDLVFSNGVKAQYERLCGSAASAVMMVPMADPHNIILIREYAAGIEGYELTFPKGRIETGETPEQAGQRELMEEIGFGARRIVPLRDVYLAPGYSDYHCHILLAQDLYPQKLKGDEPEPIETLTWPVDDIGSLLNQSDLTEARSLLALFLLRDYLAATGA